MITRKEMILIYLIDLYEKKIKQKKIKDPKFKCYFNKFKSNKNK